MYSFIFIGILTFCIIVHEAGHYFAARHYGVKVERASLFYNLFFTLLKYDPVHGRLDLVSRKIVLERVGPYGYQQDMPGEKVFLSIMLSRYPYSHAQCLDANGNLIFAPAVCVNKVFLRPQFLPDTWRNTQWCIGWLPVGGYVSLNGRDINRLNPKRKLLINAAGVLVNLACVFVMTALMYFAISLPILYTVLYNVAYLSLILFLLNILPIPMLDGGHIVDNSIELCNNPDTRNSLRKVYNVVGWCMLALFLLSYTDIINLNGLLDDSLTCIFNSLLRCVGLPA